MEEKEKAIGPANLNSFLRYEYLKAIDSRWQDHLENMEALREAVYLRAYGQKNPLLEYKLEGFKIFDQLIYDIRSSIARKVIKVKIQRPEVRVPVRSSTAGQASHVQLGQFAMSNAAPARSGDGASVSAQRRAPGSQQGATAARQGAAAGPQSQTVRRSYPKVGRNDPCPCGSGKKYKFCHGR